MARLLVTIAVLSTAAGVTVTPARAAEPSLATQPYRTVPGAQFWNIVSQPANDPSDPRGFQVNDPAKTRAGLMRARSAGRLLPRIGTLSTVAAVAGAFTVGWKVGGLIQGSDWFQQSVLGFAPTPTVLLTSYSWQRHAAGSTTADRVCGVGVGCWSLLVVMPAAGGRVLFPTPAMPDFTYYNSLDEGLEELRDSVTALAATVAGDVTAETTGRTVSGEYGTGGTTALLSIRRTMADMEGRATSPLARPYVAGDPYTNTYTVPTDAGTPADIAAARASLDAETDRDVRDYINKLIDPGYDGGYSYTMPNCTGLTASACEAAITSAANSTGAAVPSFSVTTASTADADLIIAAGQAISTAPAASWYGQPSTVTITRNPDPLPIVFPPAYPFETYAQYVQRLRNLGWFGTATVVGLTATEGDPAYAVAGVPCTSVSAGSRIDASDAVSFYQNPTTTFSSSDGSGGGACGGGYSTPSGGDCEFNDAINIDYQTWDDVIAEYGPYYLDAECAEAWQKLVDEGFLNSDFTLTGTATSDAINLGTQIRNFALIALLPTFGDSIEFWRKVKIDISGGAPLETDDGHRFELHFYRDSSLHTYTGRDFKVVFRDYFTS